MLWNNRGILASLVLAIAVAVLINGQPSRVKADDKPAVGGPGKAAVALETKDISLDQAHAILAAAVAKATETKTKMDIAVVDAGGNLKAFVAWMARGSAVSISPSRRRRRRDISTLTPAISENFRSREVRFIRLRYPMAA